MKMGLRAALVSTFLFASGAPLVVFWFWPHSAALQNKVEEVRERHLLLAKNLGSALEIYHRDLVAVFDAFAPKIAIGGAEEAKSIFLNLHFRHVCVADPDSGEVRRAYLASTYKCPPAVPADRLAMFRELAASDSVALSNVFAPEGEDPRIYVVKRVGDVLVVGAIQTTFFRELQRRISFGRKGHAAIVDGSGRVLAHPLSDWTARAADISKVSAVQRMIAGESGVEIFYSPALKGDMIAGFTAVPGTGWGAMVPQPLAELEEVAKQINHDAFFVLSAGLVLSWIIAWWVSSRVARRIGRVEAATMRVAEGAGRVHVDEDRSFLRVRELSNLEDGFNRMADEIEDARGAESERADVLELANRALRSEIAERRNAEAALKESEKRFRNLFESEPIAIREEDFSLVKSEIDALGIEDSEMFSAYLDEHPAFVKKCADLIVVVDANIAAMKLHGLDNKAELLRRVTKNLSDKALETLKTTLVAVHRGQTLQEFETSVSPVNGPSRTVEARWAVAAGYEKTYGRILLISIDVTERRETEERLKQAQKMEAVGQLTGGVAHDFNNLLAVIGGNAELLADGAGGNAALTGPIKLAVKRGAELTQRLLAFSRQQPLRPQVVEIGGLVSGLSDLLGRALGETIELEPCVAPNLWNALADSGQVENALLNLAINARDAMPDGGKLIIECYNAELDDAQLADNPEATAGDYVVLAVSDDGTGMPAEVKARAFEPFFTTKEVGEGSGLGLSMVYGFAKQSGGHVTIYSEVGRGTTVKLYLPRALEAGEDKVVHKDKGDIPRGRGELVLVVEDNPEVRVLVVIMLKKLGYQVLDVPDVASAQRVLAEERPVDIVLSDVVLPGGRSGMEFAEEARRTNRGLKVIFMSGYSSEAAMCKGPLEPDSILLNKPFKMHQLATALRDQLAQGASV